MSKMFRNSIESNVCIHLCRMDERAVNKFVLYRLIDRASIHCLLVSARARVCVCVCERFCGPHNTALVPASHHCGILWLRLAENRQKPISLIYLCPPVWGYSCESGPLLLRKTNEISHETQTIVQPKYKAMRKSKWQTTAK